MSRNRSRGVTLIELMVVIALITALSLVFIALLGSFSSGDPLRQSATSVVAMIQRGRSAALSRASRYEVLVDFAGNSIWPLERIPLHFFSFESDNGSIGTFLEMSKGIELSDANPPMLQGKALESFQGDGALASFRLNAQGEMGPDDGLVIRFDLRLDLNPGETGRIIGEGNRWSVEVDEVIGASAWLKAEIGGVSIIARNAVPTWRWTSVELLVSPMGSRLYVNGIPSSKSESGASSALMFSGRMDDAQVEIGSRNRGSNFLMDNLRVERLNVTNKLNLDELWNIKLMPPDSDAMLVADDQVWKDKPLDTSIVQVISSEEGIGPLRPSTGTDLVVEPPLAAIIFFDRQGMLDGHWHDAELRLTLLDIAPDKSTIRRQDVVISTSGDVRIEGQPSIVNRAVVPEDDGIPITGRRRTK